MIKLSTVLGLATLIFTAGMATYAVREPSAWSISAVFMGSLPFVALWLGARHMENELGLNA